MTDVQHAVLLQRPVFKMNPATEFWQQQRGANHMSMGDNPPSPSNDNTLLNNNNNTQCTSLNNNNNNATTANHMATNDSAMANNISSTSSGDPNNPPDQVMALSNNLVPEVHSTSPTPEPQNQTLENPLNNVTNALTLSDPKLMTEKLVSELQIFMHKSAMQMQMQRAGSVGGASSLSGGLEANKPHQCQQCLKSFSSNHQLVQHIRVHTGEKPYKCTYCERRFKQLSHVQQHTRLHTGERPYRCHLTECGRAFIQLSNLQQHLRNHDAQLERAKSRPFHCNICGKGFATESSLRTHTSKAQWNHGLNHVRVSCGTQEVELRTDMLQQHAAFIGGTNAATCPLCHKFFLGGEALVEHMKLHHKDPPSGVTTPTSEISGIGPYLAKRRTANHPCPVCGKHYVNEGSLRKHMACHPETAQLASTLRMWPCSVCQAVFTHESGLLSHMEHMRMDPKHQFAAQYVLSRAAAERRERENILATAALGLPISLGTNPSQCESPSGHSDTSSQNGERLSSAGSDPGNNFNNNNNNNNNNNMTAAKLAELMAGRAVANNGYYLGQQTQYNANDLQRAATALIQQQAQVAAAAAQVQAQAQAQNQSVNSGSQQVPGNQAQNCTSTIAPESPNAATAVQVAAANLAAAMRMSQNQANSNSLQQSPNQNNQRPWKKESMDDSHSMNGPQVGNASPDMSAVQLAAMNAAMRASMSSMVDQSQSLLHQQQQSNTSPTLRMQEAFLRSQAEALRLAVSQAVAASTTQQSDNNSLRQHSIATTIANNTQNFNHQGQVSPDLTEALRLQEQRLEQALRLHGDPRALGFSLPNHQHP